MTIDPHTTSRIDDCQLIALERHHHANGNLTVVEDHSPIPFKLRRAFYLYDIPGGESRGGHSHHGLYQLLVAISGCFDVMVDDGMNKHRYTLNRPYQGLLVPPGIWSVLENFSSGSVCLCLASEPYSEADYVRDYDDFLTLTASKRES